MNTRNISLAAMALCVLTMIPSCQHVVYAADMANLNRQYERGEITKKEYAERKAHFDFERSLAGPVIRMGTFSEEQNRNRDGGQSQLSPARVGGSVPYAYSPSPQYVYVQGPAHRPGGGYTPQPQQVYVQGPAHNPGGGYTPQPQQAYVYNTPHTPGGGYTPQPQQVYAQNSQRTPGGGYTPQPQQAYVQNPQRSPAGGYTPQPNSVLTQNPKEAGRGDAYASSQTSNSRYVPRSGMTAAELKKLDEQTLKPEKITANPWDLAGKPNIDKHEAKKASYGPVVQKLWTEGERALVEHYIPGPQSPAPEAKGFWMRLFGGMPESKAKSEALEINKKK